MRGEMDTTATIALIGFSLIVGAYLLSRLIGAMRVNRPKLPPLACYGDFPWIPQEMRRARNSGGGKSDIIDGRAVTHSIDVRTHRGSAK
jgi:hypothetical protein